MKLPMKLLIIFFLIYSGVAHGSAVICHVKMSRLFSAFKKAWSADGVYYPNNCCSNVTRLYEEMKKANPRIEPEDFNVVMIAHHDLSPETVGEPRFDISIRHQRGNGNPPSKPWAYHVILAYKGFVFDLDNSNIPTVSPIRDYLKEQFKPQDRRTLVAYVVPGATYLSYRAGTQGQAAFRVVIPEDYQAIPLSWLPHILE